jgi:hypothetical protein
MEKVMVAVKVPNKKILPPPGRKVGVREALARTNQKFGKALAKLAK